MKQFLSLLKFIIGWPLSLIALFFVGKILLKQHVFLSLGHIDWYLLGLSILCFLSYFFLRTLFWQKLLETQKIHYSFKQTATIWGLAELKRYVPGNIWSFLSRTYAYTKQKHSGKIIVKSLLTEIKFLVFASMSLSLLSINFLVFGFITFPFQHVVSIILTFTVFLLIFFVVILPKKNHALDNAFHLFLMTLAFFFFGLGTYFSITTIFYLYPGHILPLIGFFVFSYLVGYLSFITPMGLGVREAIITAGLAKYVDLSHAALGAIFSRIMLIVSELLFIGLSLAWEKGQKYTQKVETFLLTHKYEVALLLMVVLYCVYFTLASFLRYNNFFTGRFDLGNMDQTVWNTIHGRFFQLTNPDGTNIVSRLSFHADYLLVLLAPFYYIWQDPRMLLFIQTIVLGVGSIFVYLIGKRVFNNKFISCIFAILFLINPSVNNTNLYDFHAVTLATTFLLAAWYFLLQENDFLLVFFLFLAGTTKEEIWFTTGLIGLYLLIFRRKWIVGTLVSVFSFGLFYYLLWHAIPAARGGNHFAISYYSDFGSSQLQVIKNALFSPVKIVTTIAKNGSIRFLYELFAPLGFLSLLAPQFLFFAAGDFAIDLLSNNSQLHNITFQYTASLTPFIFLSSMYGFALLLKFIKASQALSKYFTLILFCFGIFCAYFFGPLPGARTFNHDVFTNQLAYAGDIDSFLNSIPHRYSIASSNNVGSHLSHRPLIYTIPIGIDKADIIVLLLNDQYAQPSLKAQKQLAEKLRKDPLYVKLFEKGDFIVFKKKSVPTYTKRQSKALFPLFKGS